MTNYLMNVIGEKNIVMFLKSIKINKDIVLESNRKSQEKFFEIKTDTYQIEDRRNPIINPKKPFERHKYKKKTVTDHSFIIHKKDFQLDFKEGITIIVGDNGCGKSHLLSYLEPKFLKEFFFKEEHREKQVKDWLSNDKYTLTFCSQPENLIQGKEIHKNSFMNNLKNDLDSKSQGIGGSVTPNQFLHFWDSQTYSNGESVLDFIDALKDLKNSLIILDEPETSLSIKSQSYIKNIFKTLIENGNQLILITHSIFLMKLHEEVYDFENRIYTNTKSYIKDQLKNK